MYPLLFEENPDQMQHMTLQVSPSQLIGILFFPLDIVISCVEHGVQVFQVKQDPGSWIVTFPMAYHGGFSYGVRYLS